MAQLSNLLDDALDGKGAGGRMILVEDCVKTSGAFVLHHLLKRCLSPDSSDFVVFLSFAHPFSHYDRILRKMGCNLSTQIANRRLLVLDLLMIDDHLGGQRGKTSDDILIAMYGKIHKAVEVCQSHEEAKRHVTVFIDDVSLMEIGANGSSNLVLDFLRYCSSLTSQFLAHVVIKVEPLATGLAADVHGQLTVMSKGLEDSFWNSRNKVHNFQFRIKDNGIDYFYPGSKT